MIRSVLLTWGGRRRYSTPNWRSENLKALKKLSYDFYKKCQDKKNCSLKLYNQAITVHEFIEKMFKEDIYNSQSYILILKGFMNISGLIKEERKRNNLLKMMNTSVGFFTKYVHIMNEQDVTLLLDIMAKCAIRNSQISELIIQRLGKNERNSLFYTLNSKSVCIILNSLYKLNIQSDENGRSHFQQYVNKTNHNIYIQTQFVSDIYYFYVYNKYSNFNLTQLIILLHSMYRYNYEKCKVSDLISYISKRILTINELDKRTKDTTIPHKHGDDITNPDTSIMRHDSSVKNSQSIKILEERHCLLKRKIEGTPERRLNETHGVHKKVKSFLPSCQYRIKDGEYSQLFDMKNKYELILFYTLSCYNYCNNELLQILLNKIKNKVLLTYREKEVCMLVQSVCHFFILRTTKKFEKYVTNEENSINEDNQLCASNLIETIIVKNTSQLENYTKFSIATIYIMLSKLNFFFENKHLDVFFMQKLFSTKYLQKKKNKIKKIYFSCVKDNFTLKTVIGLLFSFTLNDKREQHICYYDLMLDCLHMKLLLDLGENITAGGRIHYKMNELLDELSVQNVQLLCVIYTYLFLHNMLIHVKIKNLHFFNFLLSNFNYLNCMYLKQHVSSKIHTEINTTIASIKKKTKNNFLLTNECYIFPYYVDICLSSTAWAGAYCALLHPPGEIKK
ncbi:hypothetical protein, conserved [Plasmodium gonderi]|uniref:Uncharacterized protein n=1 Tax=Plasmodium gonderi TaxID=77519 RepID=A0A1Y1JIH8_PLAGO|nr:hypothetical protein, conserved [Plasmodium gonderi]GAW81438.1 hypothetical protein, conserved [Plasmodium gonderi]